jgi:iron complex outermembrane receptor protein
MQISVPRASALVGLQNSLENAGKAEIWGSEAEVVAIPLRGLEASVNYGLTLPKFTEYFEQAFDPVTGLPIFDSKGEGVRVNVANQRKFTITPEHTLTVGLTYTAPPTSSGTFSAHIDTFWQDKITFQPNGIDRVGQGSYAIVNGRLQFVGIPLEKGTLDVAVFARNLTDTWYLTSVLDFGSSLGWIGSRYGEPRTFGVQLTYNFTAS